MAGEERAGVAVGPHAEEEGVEPRHSRFAATGVQYTLFFVYKGNGDFLPAVYGSLTLLLTLGYWGGS